MSSGYGLSGGPSRCFPFWQEVLACYVVNTNAEDDSGKKKCMEPLEDYYECLHHKKEAAKILTLQNAYRRREAATSRDAAPSAGQIRSLGLLDVKDAEVDIQKAGTLPSLTDNRPRGAGDKPTPSATMETMTSSFPSSAPGDNHVQLDNIIFYPGPASAKTREITPINADEWPEIDMIFAGDSQHEWVVRTKHLDQASDFEITGGDIRNVIDMGSAAQAAVSTKAYLEDISTPLCNSFDHSRSGFADRGRSAKSQEPLDIRGSRVESVPAGTSDTVRPNVQHNSWDDGTAVQDCPLDDGTSLALWDAFCGKGSIAAPATGHPTSLPRDLETDGPNLPLHPPGLPIGSPNDMAAGDESLLRKGGRAQQSQLIDGHKQSSASPAALESFPASQGDTSRAASDISANTAISEASTCDRAHYSRSAAIADVGDAYIQLDYCTSQARQSLTTSTHYIGH